MPRHARLHAPGALVHIIARFVNRQYRLAGPQARAAVVERLPRALARCDWQLCAYALMSNHMHLAMLAGMAPPYRFLKPLLISVASWLNRADHTFGPVFAGRATTIYMDPVRMAPLVSYIHNNPVRAGLVPSAIASDWTSHRCWIGLSPAPAWLAVARGLSWAGFDATEQGQRDFDDYVQTHRQDGHSEELSGTGQGRARAQTRRQTRLPVEVSAPILTSGAGRSEHVVLYPVQQRPAARWEGDLSALLHGAAAQLEVSLEELCSPSKRPSVVQARRLALVAGAWLLRREQQEIAAAIGISSSAASRLLRRADLVMALAVPLAASMRA